MSGGRYGGEVVGCGRKGGERGVRKLQVVMGCAGGKW